MSKDKAHTNAIVAWSLLVDKSKIPSLLIFFPHCPVIVSSTITITKKVIGWWVTYGQQKPFPDGYNAYSMHVHE